MYAEERSFLLRVSLEAHFPDGYDGDDDEHAWAQEWETRMKPEVLKAVFSALRRHDGWSAHVRNRGASERDEIEIVVAKDFGP
ncbi:MAG: hypothetical protein ABIO65_08160 [Nitrospiria bacterium]